MTYDAGAVQGSGTEPGFLKHRFGRTIELRQDRGTSLLSWFFGVLLVSAVAALVFGRFARTESVRGYVSATSGLSRLDAQAPGIVTRIDVKQGEAVRRGQRLMQIDLREQTTGGQSTVSLNRRSLADRQTILRTEEASLSAFLSTAGRDQAGMQANTASVFRAFDDQDRSLRTSLKQQTEVVHRIGAYVRQGYATRDALNTQLRTQLEYERQIAEMQAKRAVTRQDADERLRALRAASVDKAAQLSSIRNELSTIGAQLGSAGAMSHLDIVSPIDGQVSGLFAEVNASVAADQIVAIVGEAQAQPLVILEVPARTIGLTKVGQDVVLKYDAFPFKSFGVAHGEITAISASPLRSPAVAMAAAGDAAPDPAALDRQSTYRVEVRPFSATVRAYGIDEPIRLGSTLTADIVVERRRLIDWVLDPIRAMRGR